MLWRAVIFLERFSARRRLAVLFLALGIDERGLVVMINPGNEIVEFWSPLLS